MKFVESVPETTVGPYRTKVYFEVEELKQYPGHWALVREAASSTGISNSYKKYGCLTTTRRTAEGKWDIYACWPTSSPVKGAKK